MKILLRAAIAAMSIGTIPPAIAGEAGPDPDTFLTELPGMVAQPPPQLTPTGDPAKQGRAVQNASPWLFPPVGQYFNQHAGG